MDYRIVTPSVDSGTSQVREYDAIVIRAPKHEPAEEVPINRPRELDLQLTIVPVLQ